MWPPSGSASPHRCANDVLKEVGTPADSIGDCPEKAGLRHIPLAAIE
jgi:hypothetical protein